MRKFNAKTFRYMRLSSGQTQRELAQAAGYSVQLVSSIENGIVRPSIDSLAAFAAAMGCRPGDLFSHDAERSRKVGA